MECVFCEIIAKKIPAEFLAEHEQIVIFKDKNSVPPIHLLVVPKRHIDSVMGLAGTDRDIVAEMIYAAKELAAKMKLNGYKLLFNVGREGGQMVDHLHLHLMAGWKSADERKKLWKAIEAGSLDI